MFLVKRIQRNYVLFKKETDINDGNCFHGAQPASPTCSLRMTTSSLQQKELKQITTNKETEKEKYVLGHVEWERVSPGASRGSLLHVYNINLPMSCLVLNLTIYPNTASSNPGVIPNPQLFCTYANINKKFLHSAKETATPRAPDRSSLC